MATKPTSKPKQASKKAPKPTSKAAPKSKTTTKPKPAVESKLAAKQELERFQAQLLKQVPAPSTEQETKPLAKSLMESEPEPSPEESESNANVLAIIRNVLNTHELMDYLPDCVFKLDDRSSKHGDIYRLYLDEQAYQVGITCKGERYAVGGKYYFDPAEAAKALCDTLLAHCKGERRK
jgi:hypothetical protein